MSAMWPSVAARMSGSIREQDCMAELRYAVVLEPCPPKEGGGFTVTVPALPEIVTQGDTLDNALFMARVAIRLSRCD